MKKTEQHIETHGNHSHIAIAVKDDKTSSIANAIIEALNYFEEKNPSLEMTSWKLERFDNADTTDFYLFINHKKIRRCERKK